MTAGSAAQSVANQASDPVARARGLVVAYGPRVAIASSDFEVPSACVTAVIGPNGSGKSTLLHALAGLVRPHSGTLEVLGGAPEHAHDRVAYVLQTAGVNRVLPVTVGEVVAMGRYGGRGLIGRWRPDDREAVDHALARLDIVDLAGRHLRELSTGQRQRALVAQGLAQQADVLLLDEPVTALDIPSHEAIDVVIEEEVASGRTVVITTHDLDEARRADHVLLLGGRVVAEGSPGEVLTDERLLEAYGAHLLHAEPGDGQRAVSIDDPHHHTH
ncbi:MAG: metal ABC transporter ATP-binding protein [Actinobacteria bacterium]|nr:metal ABC transporter ATP-binding protein [Actinomycetota bacterium]